MEIIKHGDGDKIKKIKGIELFECYDCGCTFEANRDEYYETITDLQEYGLVCDCPDCGREIFKELKRVENDI